MVYVKLWNSLRHFKFTFQIYGSLIQLDFFNSENALKIRNDVFKRVKEKLARLVSFNY